MPVPFHLLFYICITLVGDSCCGIQSVSFRTQFLSMSALSTWYRPLRQPSHFDWTTPSSDMGPLVSQISRHKTWTLRDEAFFTAMSALLLTPMQIRIGWTQAVARGRRRIEGQSNTAKLHASNFRLTRCDLPCLPVLKILLTMSIGFGYFVRGRR